MQMLYLSILLKYSVFINGGTMDYCYRFPVVRGIQAGRDYYIAMVPLKMIPKLFPDDEEYVAPEHRAQRRLNETRIPVISKYITDNRDSYVFSALAASIDGAFSFVESENVAGVGTLEVSMDSRFLINDGQHRKAAIISALKEDDSLGEETISVVFYEDKGLDRSQQIFTDLNKHAVKTSNSLSELYDSRDPIAVVTREAIKQIDFFDKYTDKEKDNLGKFSSNLFTLNVFYRANKRIFGNLIEVSEKDIDFLVTYWDLVSNCIDPWQELEKKIISKKDLRENYIVTQGVVIQALGIIGRYFYLNDKLKKEEILQRLNNINWKRNSKDWKFRTIRPDGRIIANDKAVLLTSNVIKNHIGIPLDEDEAYREEEFMKNII